jgi:hypothetical protein
MRNFIICKLLFTKYYQGYQIREMRWTGHVAHIEELRQTYKTMVRKPDGNRELGRNRRVMEE